MGSGSASKPLVKSPVAQHGTGQIDKASAAAGASPAEVYGNELCSFRGCLRQLHFRAACNLFVSAFLSS